MNLNENEDQLELFNTQPTEKRNMEITWPNFIVFFGVLLGVMLVGGVLLGIVSMIMDTAFDVNWMSIFDGYNALIIDAIVFLIVFMCFKTVRQFTMKALDYSVLKLPKTYGYLVLSFVLFFIIQLVFIQLIEIDDATAQQEMLFDSMFGDEGITTMQTLLLFLAVAILTPIKEELIFRGIIHRFFEHRYHFWVGLIISSLIFGLLHFGFPWSAIFMGAVFVWLYRVTNSLLPPILLHIAWNGFAALLMIMSL